jgi:hypothetical protein
MTDDPTGPECPARRALLGGLAAGVAVVAAPAAAQQPTPATGTGGDDALAAAFARLLRPETRADMLLPDAVVIESDVPFPLSRTGALDHLAFHRDLWDSRAWVPYDLRTRSFGDSAFVSAYLMERGKPKTSGFRLQPIYATATMVRTTAGWRALSLHLGAIRGQLTDISPG